MSSRVVSIRLRDEDYQKIIDRAKLKNLTIHQWTKGVLLWALEQIGSTQVEEKKDEGDIIKSEEVREDAVN